jgi:hypothetical protein
MARCLTGTGMDKPRRPRALNVRATNGPFLACFVERDATPLKGEMRWRNAANIGKQVTNWQQPSPCSIVPTEFAITFTAAPPITDFNTRRFRRTEYGNLAADPTPVTLSSEVLPPPEFQPAPGKFLHKTPRSRRLQE